MKRLISITLAAVLALLLSSNANGQISPDGARVPPATSLNIPTQLPTNTWTLGRPVLPAGNFEILRNGKVAAGGGSVLTLCKGVVFLLDRTKAWWKVIKEDGVSVVWERAASMPCDGVVVVPPVDPPPPGKCTLTNSGGKFTVGDKVTVDPATGGMNMRALPDIDTAPLSPFQPINAEGIVSCVQIVAGQQWVQVGGFKVAPNIGWARETGFDKVGPIVILPPPPPPPNPDVPPVVDASYYVAPNGDDNNPGTLALPFKTMQKGCAVLKPGQKTVVRDGEYDATANSFTTNGSTSVCPSGNSWQEPVMMQAYPGERPVLRRYLPAGSTVTEEQMRGGVHLATPKECKERAAVPYPCWSGGGVAPGWLSVLDVATHGFLDGAVFRIYGPSKYIIWDGIDIDGRGIVAATLQLSCNQGCNTADDYDGPKHMRFINMEIRNSISSCTSAPGAVTEAQTDLQFIKVWIHHCGVPYDTNFYNDDPKQGLARLNPNARFYHPWYMHTGGNMLIDSETSHTAGTGLSPDGDNNIITGNYIHDNASHGLLIGGGQNWRVENNVFTNNGGIEIYSNSGQPGHYVAHNTIIKGSKNTEYSWGMYLGRGSYGGTYENNIIDGFLTPVRNEATYPNFGYTPINVLRNNIIRAKAAGSEIVTGAGTCPECPVPPTIIGNKFNADPMLDANYKPLPGSPAIGAGTDGKNIGAR